MVLDTNGVPVWYRNVPLGPAQNVTALDGNKIAWLYKSGPGFSIYPDAAFEVLDLKSGITTSLQSPLPPTDGHELVQLNNGDFMMLATPLRANVDLSPIGLGQRRTIVDCVVQEVDSRGQLVWSWRASDHIGVAESTHPFTSTVLRQLVFDVFHCNSVDVDPTTGDVLLSVRHADAVYLIDRATGHISWRLGGRGPNPDGAELIQVTSDPLGTFHAQHDARFRPDGDVSLFDDQSWDARLPARAIEYHIDLSSRTAHPVWTYTASDRHNSAATGSFRRLLGGADNVIGWGFKPNSLFTEVDAQGNVMLEVEVQSGQSAYRVLKVPTAALDLKLLRADAGTLAPIVWPRPAVAFVGPAGGPTRGGTTVTITGSFAPGASRVQFGTSEASFTVIDAATIVAVAPPGTGSATVTVVTPGGTSPAISDNQLAATFSDSSFEFGTGSWNATNASVLLTAEYSRSGEYSMEVAPDSLAGTAVATGLYEIPGGANVKTSAWVLMPGSGEPTQSTIAFFDSNKSILSVRHGSQVVPPIAVWTQVQIAAQAPLDAKWVAVGIAVGPSATPFFVDDATLVGTTSFDYAAG